MAELFVDLVCLFVSPLLSDPEDELRLRLLGWLVHRYMSQCAPLAVTIRVKGQAFVASRHMQTFYGTLEEVCNLLDIPPSCIAVTHDVREESALPLDSVKNEQPSDGVSIAEYSSAFEESLMKIFEPLLDYQLYYQLYGLTSVEHVLLCGVNSGKRFIRWFRGLQNGASWRGHTFTDRKLAFHLIRIEEILSPYFGESERRLVLLFDSAVSSADDGLTCICIEGIHHFQSDKECLDDLNRRLLATLLLLLDSVSKSDVILPRNRGMANARRPNGSLVVVATSENHPDMLSDALTRPGRLDKTIFVS
ncbi:ATPase family AAA domain-containing protein At1g05910 [Babesia caballi]|uniref:ATPase family AAA domain-containing protein At1g05910 n=1 Tax=Babesia caballi TaxID=5871 RepID=A0AAV4LZX7_BABCB|nr:ATPase family AAA domain-containing protein At1g05910 [Babesia caballi]